MFLLPCPSPLPRNQQHALLLFFTFFTTVRSYTSEPCVFLINGLDPPLPQFPVFTVSFPRVPCPVSQGFLSQIPVIRCFISSKHLPQIPVAVGMILPAFLLGCQHACMLASEPASDPAALRQSGWIA